MVGWVKLHRNLKDWEWYDDINATRLLIHLLLSVNFEDKKWRGTLIKSGSMVLSWKSLSNDCGLSIQKCRTAMYKLKECGQVTIKSTSKYQVVTLLKWGKLQQDYSDVNKQINIDPTNKQQSNNNEITTTKEVKKLKEVKKGIIERKSQFKELLTPFLENYSKDLLNDFYSYWTEHGVNDRKMRFEKEKSFSLERRLQTWKKNDLKFKKEDNGRYIHHELNDYSWE